MTLNKPIKLPEVVITDLDPTVADNALRKVATMSSPGMRRSIVLWQGQAYDAMGDWTQADVENRIEELRASGELAKCF